MIRVVVASVILASAVACGDPAATPERSRSPSPLASSRDFDDVERFEIDGRPSDVTVEDDLVWITDDEVNVVRVLDERTGEPSGDPIDVDRHPIAIDSYDGVVWVGHAGGELARIDAASREIESARIGMSITDVIATEQGVFTIDHAAKTASEIDPESGSVVRGITVPRGAVRGAVSDAALDKALWVTGDESDVSRVELAPFVVRHVYKDIGDGPIGIHWDGEHVWSANSDDGTITDVEGTSFDEPIEVGGAPVALTDVDGVLYVVVQDDHALVRVRDGEATGDEVDLGLNPRAIEAADDAVWVVGTTESDGGVVRVAA